MKAKTLDQPHPTLIIIGEQTMFTTAKRAPVSLVGQRFAIHAAAKRVPAWAGGDGWWYDAAGSLWQSNERGQVGKRVPAPLGCIVATAVLADCVPIVDGDDDDTDWVDLPYPRIESSVGGGDFADGWLSLYHPDSGAIDPDDGFPITEQAPYGDFTPGRWAWLLDSVEPVTEKCPTCGGAGGERMYLSHGDFDSWTCATCDGTGRCDPIPAKGRQGLWNWSPPEAFAEVVA